VDEGTNYSWLNLFDQMFKGKFEGFFAWGQNPACSGANANKVRNAMAQLKWMVNVNLYDNETGSFWKGPGMDTKAIQTEVFMLAMRLLHREGRKHQQFEPSRSVEIQGNRTRRAVDAGCGNYE